MDNYIRDYSDHLNDKRKFYSEEFIKGNLDIVAILNNLEFTNCWSDNPESFLYWYNEQDYCKDYVSGKITACYIELTANNKELLSPIFKDINDYTDLNPGWTGSNSIDLMGVLWSAIYLGYGVIHCHKYLFFISPPEYYTCVEGDKYPHPRVYVHDVTYYSCESDPSKEPELPF
ncbi:hypothetical protein [Myroides odoratimimus]|uniref:Uncharacterized protein n=1 Tax=Myroides odoratimimus CIP 101113 TaxID=883154 RepID=A0AAV3F543_9FLAO|nr:hypothetical protein [Myroides odoratimimus]EHO13829.1 hypothetical protein HMPREF9715_00903 [Myroides odoratimimus CIP 101113]